MKKEDTKRLIGLIRDAEDLLQDMESAEDDSETLKEIHLTLAYVEDAREQIEKLRDLSIIP